MGKLIVELYGHPILFVIVLLFILEFLGMTYNFILRLFGKPSDLHSATLTAGKDKEDDEEEDGAEPDSEDEFEEKDEDEEKKKDNYDNPFKRI